MTMGLNNTRLSFAEHNKYMQEFRRAHGNLALVNSPRPEEPSLVDITRPLSARQINVEPGGLRIPASTMGWTSFVPLHRVASYKLSAN